MVFYELVERVICFDGDWKFVGVVDFGFGFGVGGFYLLWMAKD